MHISIEKLLYTTKTGDDKQESIVLDVQTWARERPGLLSNLNHHRLDENHLLVGTKFTKSQWFLHPRRPELFPQQ